MRKSEWIMLFLEKDSSEMKRKDGMKKRMFRKLMILSMVFLTAAAGCSTRSQETPGSGSDSPETENHESSAAANTDSGNILVMYFSRTGEQYRVGKIDKGNTAIVAEMIAEFTGADSFEILPADDHYPATYDELTEIAKEEQNDQARPEYRQLPDLSEYDTIFIGSPVWWADWPMIMYHIFETNDLSGKTLIPFNTNEGSGIAGFEDKLKLKCPRAEVLEGLAVRGHDAQENTDEVRQAVRHWLDDIGY